MPSPPVAEEVPEAVLEQWRQYHESERQWALRRRFILRHLRGYPGAAIDQLLALSVLWANHVFMGCRSVGLVLSERNRPSKWKRFPTFTSIAVEVQKQPDRLWGC
uniref:XRN2-binding (XTBD) domain-containing protein n=1 Tax=Anas platyrhynchos platyrhynchos TaxID=8840 RepID=A0A493TB23_ANAPP